MPQLDMGRYPRLHRCEQLSLTLQQVKNMKYESMNKLSLDASPPDPVIIALKPLVGPLLKGGIVS